MRFFASLRMTTMLLGGVAEQPPASFRKGGLEISCLDLPSENPEKPL
jgi:hypothetical protein